MITAKLPGAMSKKIAKARLALGIIFFINGMVIATWASRIPAIQLKLGLSAGPLGIALLSMGIGALISLSFAGWICSKFGSQKVIFATVNLLCFSLIFPAFASNLALLSISIVVMGVISATLDVAMNAHAVLLQRNYEQPIMSSFHALWSIGGIAGACTGAAMAYANIKPELHFPGVAVVLFVLGMVITGWLVPSAADTASGAQPIGNALSNLLHLSKSRFLIVISTVMFCCFLVEGAMADWSTVFLQEVLHASPGFAVLGYAGFSITMAMGRLCGDWLNNRLGQVALVLGGSLMATLGLSMVLLPMNQVLAVIGFCCVGIGVSNIVPIAFSAAGKTKDLDAAPAIALVALLGYFGLLVGPALIGFAAEFLSLRIALGLLTILLLVMALVSRDVVGDDISATQPKHQ